MGPDIIWKKLMNVQMWTWNKVFEKYIEEVLFALVTFKTMGKFSELAIKSISDFI